jgi:hypothetical protein
LPVVASAVLVRQLGWLDGLEVQSARDADAFARATARLLCNDVCWTRQQHAAWQRCAVAHNTTQFVRDVQRSLEASQPPVNGE